MGDNDKLKLENQYSLYHPEVKAEISQLGYLSERAQTIIKWDF